MINSAGRVRQCLASEIAVAVVFAIAYSRDSWTCFRRYLVYRPILQAARQTTAGSIDFREVQIASNGSKVSKSRHNSRTKLRMELLNVQKRDNTEYYLPYKFQCSPFSVFCKTDITDGMTHTHTNKQTTVCLRPRHNYKEDACVSPMIQCSITCCTDCSCSAFSLSLSLILTQFLYLHA